jgi:hypothetical protein
MADGITHRFTYHRLGVVGKGGIDGGQWSDVLDRRPDFRRCKLCDGLVKALT